MKKSINFTNIIIIGLIVILIGSFVYYGPKLLNMIDDKYDLPDDLNQNEDYHLIEETSCNYYDITDEYYKSFTLSSLESIERNCILMGGTLTKTDNEYSCYWDPTIFTINCDQRIIEILDNFCEQSLKARYVCEPDLAYLGCLCDEDLPDFYNNIDDEEDDWNDGEEYDVITCYDIKLPMFGDLGGICSEDASCPDNKNCDHYWDYGLGEHHCACVGTTYCGQYCYVYPYNAGCECPPNSLQIWSSRSTYQCVPNRYDCIDGSPIEQMEPFPE